MRKGHRHAITAASAAVAVALVAAPLPALAEQAATGDLTVTRFDDRYADGVFDTTKVSAYGESDRLNSSGPAQLVDVNGKRWYISADTDGLYRFVDVPVGPATLYLGHPNDPAREVFFDATGATSAADIERLETRQYWGAQGALDLVIGEGDQSRVVGMTALGITAKVSYADGAVVNGLSTIEFGSNGEWFAGTEYAGLPGGYEALVGYNGVSHLPQDLGMRITAPDGYRVASVTAATGSAPLSYPDIPMEVTERDGAYFVDALDVPQYFFDAAFFVTLEKRAEAVKPTVTVKSGASFTVGADGVYDLVSFKLYDAGKIDKVVLNGTEKNLTDNQWSDVNFVKPGIFGAVEGANTLVVHDVAGNTQTVTFTLN